MEREERGKRGSRAPIASNPNLRRLTGKKIETNPSNSIGVGSRGREETTRCTRLGNPSRTCNFKRSNNAIHGSLRRDVRYKGLSYSRLDIPVWYLENTAGANITSNGKERG